MAVPAEKTRIYGYKTRTARTISLQQVVGGLERTVGYGKVKTPWQRYTEKKVN